MENKEQTRRYDISLKVDIEIAMVYDWTLGIGMSRFSKWVCVYACMQMQLI